MIPWDPGWRADLRAWLAPHLERTALGLFRRLHWAPALQRFALRRRFPLRLVGVLGLVQDPAGRIALFHHTYRRRYAWGLPGGLLEQGEEPGPALVREVAEESGLTISVGSPDQPRIRQVLLDHQAGQVEIILDARLVGGAFRPSHEVDELRWVERVVQLPTGEAGLKAGHRRLVEELLAAPVRPDLP